MVSLAYKYPVEPTSTEIRNIPMGFDSPDRTGPEMTATGVQGAVKILRFSIEFYWMIMP